MTAWISETACLAGLISILSACSGSKVSKPVDGTGGVSGEGGANGFVLPPNATPWTAVAQGTSCTHVAVGERCDGGWCRIPAGCFLMGSPEDEPFRGAFTEELTPVILTHSFVMQRTELTQGQWLELVELNPSGVTEFPNSNGSKTVTSCLDSTCPVANVNWWEAVEYANRLSRKEGRQECYVLSNCHGTIGSRDDAFSCDSKYRQATESIYDCTGYRLPTEAEYEYAGRAGTRTAFYSGGLAAEDAEECARVLPQLDAVAWYCANSNDESHPVAQKLANHWGLFDILGNVFEWSHSRPVMPDPGPTPWTDPYSTAGSVEYNDDHLLDGGANYLDPTFSRIAGRLWIKSMSRGDMAGFRLVRTLAEGE